ncbi:hypothetical protein C8Q74DRAFT_1213949 [Fomes fomentarius]|nr:hypothetical protein C8Q74DRAFT_1213949 [Fomes fomentarius]
MTLDLRTSPFDFRLSTLDQRLSTLDPRHSLRLPSTLDSRHTDPRFRLSTPSATFDIYSSRLPGLSQAFRRYPTSLLPTPLSSPLSLSSSLHLIHSAPLVSIRPDSRTFLPSITAHILRGSPEHRQMIAMHTKFNPIFTSLPPRLRISVDNPSEILGRGRAILLEGSPSLTSTDKPRASSLGNRSAAASASKDGTTFLHEELDSSESESSNRSTSQCFSDGDVEPEDMRGRPEVSRSEYNASRSSSSEEGDEILQDRYVHFMVTKDIALHSDAVKSIEELLTVFTYCVQGTFFYSPDSVAARDPPLRIGNSDLLVVLTMVVDKNIDHWRIELHGIMMLSDWELARPIPAPGKCRIEECRTRIPTIADERESLVQVLLYRAIRGLKHGSINDDVLVELDVSSDCRTTAGSPKRELVVYGPCRVQSQAFNVTSSGAVSASSGSGPHPIDELLRLFFSWTKAHYHVEDRDGATQNLDSGTTEDEVFIRPRYRPRGSARRHRSSKLDSHAAALLQALSDTL